MTLIAAANIPDILGSLFCFGLFAVVIAAAVWTAIREARLKSGVDIPLDEVPENVRKAATRLAPELKVSKAIVKYRKKGVVRKYELTGHVGNRPMEVEVMPRDTRPYIREIEVIYDPAYRRLYEAQQIDLSTVPPAVMQSALDHMDAIGFPVQQVDKAKQGRIFDKPACELKGSWKNGRFEMKLLVSGAVIKVELKFRDEMES